MEEITCIFVTDLILRLWCNWSEIEVVVRTAENMGSLIIIVSSTEV